MNRGANSVGSTTDRGSRRGFVGALISGVASVVGVLSVPFAFARKKDTEADTPNPQKRKRKWGMAIDLDRCAGCGACVVACKAENNVSDGSVDPKWDGRRTEWMTIRRQTAGKYPNPRVAMTPMPCNHCENAACVKVCPVGATYLSDEGIVGVVWDQCIGCRYCMMACPYSRRYFNWFEPVYTEETRLMLNPDVATRPLGVVEKCTFCHHRIRDAKLAAKQEERELVDGDVQTACQEACPARAIAFGDLNDPDSKVFAASTDPRAKRPLEELGTQAKLYYLSKGSS